MPVLKYKRKVLQLSFLICVFLFNGFSATADCLACWELKKVHITLKNDKEITGFVRWNEIWIYRMENSEELKNKFPQSLVPYYGYIKNSELLIYTQLIDVGNDSIMNFKATSESSIQKIKVSDIDTIKEIQSDSEKVYGAGDLPAFSDKELKLLKKNPYATHSFNVNVADVFFLSYSAEIKREDLAKISKTDYYLKKKDLLEQDIVIIILSYD